MTRTLALLSASLFLAAPAFAQALTSTTPGAIAGRSPHHGFREAAVNQAPCGRMMHSLPAGKLPTYGNQVEPVRCAQLQVADAEVKAATARD